MAKKKTESRVRPAGPARVESLRVQNYRALQNVELKKLTPLTVRLGSGSSFLAASA